MRNVISFLLMSGILLAGCTINAPEAKLRIITEENPPFNFTDERGYITGQSTEIVNAILKKTGNVSAIESMPWSQAYNLVQNEQNTILYSTSRMSIREQLFKWVGPIGFADNWLYSKRGANIKIASLDDARKVKSIAVYKDDSNQLFLAEKGFTNLDISSNDVACITKLVEGKVDLWLGPSEGLHFIAYRASINPAEIEAVTFVRRVEWYIAFNRSISDKTIQTWQKALDEMKKPGVAGGMSDYENIVTSYALPRYTTSSIPRDTVIQLTEKTAKDIANNAAGTFTRIIAGDNPYRDKDNPDLYVYVFDKNVIEIANANNPAVVGRSFKGVPDMAGKLFRDNIVDNALKNGTGWEDYVFTLPGKIGLYYKSAYYKLVAGSDGKQYIVCAGRYKDKPE